MRLFDRIAELTVGPKGKAGKKITDLRISFKVKKTMESSPNVATIEIYNLSEETRALVEKSGSYCIFKAGYGDTLRDMFSGDVAKVTTKKSGPDFITSLECGDGEQAFQTSFLDMSLAPGSGVMQVVDAAVGALGLAKGSILGVSDDKYAQGISLSGAARDHLDMVTAKQGLEWSIQDGKVQIIPIGKGLPRPAVHISPDTGLVGSPFKTKILNSAMASMAGTKNPEDGVTFTSLLNTDITPGRLVLVESAVVNAIVVARTVSHSGDTHGNSWNTEVEAFYA